VAGGGQRGVVRLDVGDPAGRRFLFWAVVVLAALFRHPSHTRGPPCGMITRCCGQEKNGGGRDNGEIEGVAQNMRGGAGRARAGSGRLVSSHPVPSRWSRPLPTPTSLQPATRQKIGDAANKAAAQVKPMMDKLGGGAGGPKLT